MHRLREPATRYERAVIREWDKAIDDRDYELACWIVACNPTLFDGTGLNALPKALGGR